MITVHMVGNAHIDPVWLWRWPAGVGEALHTCRTACDLLDENPDLVFTRSDVWVHKQVEELEPPLFERIRRHVAAGRWAVVGGWYVQPDCNYPLEQSFQKHIDFGRRYFLEKFGVTVTVGYNVDSFGHAASLPRILADNGYDSYVMMRPMANERTLPADLFRWRSTDETGGVRELLTWRIPIGYCISAGDLSEHVRACIASAVAGVDHVMCFYGVGDHGGGPTREQIAWIETNRDSFPGARLMFSHPRAFFDAIKPLAARLPVVQGELQMHAVGCYSAGHSLKKAMRRAEHCLLMAERCLDACSPEKPAVMREVLERAWEKTLFNQFHDTYGGTVIPDALDDALGQLAAARDDAESVLYSALFRMAARTPASREQRILAFNASDEPFEGFLQWEPWLEWRRFDGWLADPNGSPLPFQILPSPSIANMPGILLWPARLGPGILHSFSIHQGAPPGQYASDLVCSATGIANARWRVGQGNESALLFLEDVAATRLFMGGLGLRVCVLEDKSDTWSHGIDGYTGPLLGCFSRTDLSVEEKGPVRASLRADARFNQSTLSLWARLYTDDSRVELELRIDWHEKMRVAKLVLPIGAKVLDRLDGIPGGATARAQDGKEAPVVDWTLARLSNGGRIGVACPDCFALDGDSAEIRFTLLRAPAYAWHHPAVLPEHLLRGFLDQGEHLFRFTVLLDADQRALERLSLAVHRPPVCVDWTRGMSNRSE
jgi:alpha-mannosidase